MAISISLVDERDMFQEIGPVNTFRCLDRWVNDQGIISRVAAWEVSVDAFNDLVEFLNDSERTDAHQTDVYLQTGEHEFTLLDTFYRTPDRTRARGF